MVTKIFHRGKFKNVDPDKAPKDARELDSFLIYNGTNKVFIRLVGGWYKVQRDGSFTFISRTLYLLSFKEWLEIALNEK
jgi:hypothetical protein